ncbi:hypothetical protein KOW79_013390 [Hemibagrus wyckioides]|uniref:Uncharacterized protein n=1 Tax=Hemibagrus wyckioides TaxID=337641 RepID=A0A9D3SLB7_9TELE|nr:hypothetical protein KOW79_013390 [Hemibagrus wyckioides]
MRAVGRGRELERKGDVTSSQQRIRRREGENEPERATINLLERKTCKDLTSRKGGKISNKEGTCVELEDSRRRGPSRERKRERA